MPVNVSNLCKGCSRNYPQGRVGRIFFQTPPPQDTHGVRAPPSLGTHALITPRPTMDQILLDPQDKLPPPHPSDTSTKHPPPTGQKIVCGPHPPEDNFWNSPKCSTEIIQCSVGTLIQEEREGQCASSVFQNLVPHMWAFSFICRPHYVVCSSSPHLSSFQPSYSDFRRHPL